MRTYRVYRIDRNDNVRDTLFIDAATDADVLRTIGSSQDGVFEVWDQHRFVDRVASAAGAYDIPIAAVPHDLEAKPLPAMPVAAQATSL